MKVAVSTVPVPVLILIIVLCLEAGVSAHQYSLRGADTRKRHPKRALGQQQHSGTDRYGNNPTADNSPSKEASTTTTSSSRGIFSRLTGTLSNSIHAAGQQLCSTTASGICRVFQDSETAPTIAPSAAPTVIPSSAPTPEPTISYSEAPLWFRYYFWKQGAVLEAPRWMNSAGQFFFCRVLGQCHQVNQELAPTLPEWNDPYWTDHLCKTTGICITSAPTPLPTTQPSYIPSSVPSYHPSPAPTTTLAPSTAPSEGLRVKLFGLRGSDQRPICRFLVSC
jgi:hypothetical protein